MKYKNIAKLKKAIRNAFNWDCHVWNEEQTIFIDLYKVKKFYSLDITEHEWFDKEDME